MSTELQLANTSPPSATKPQTAPSASNEIQHARDHAVADMLRDAYARASTLKLSNEEAAALSAPFPDEAFRRGAGGDERLIYIEHAYLRERLNQVLGVGAAVPIRRREWAQESERPDKYGRPQRVVTVYVDLVLVVRGCVVGEAIGEAEYWPQNPRSSYSDALESAKSNAFRRCCKEFGVGLQAWMKGWCKEWERRNPPGSEHARAGEHRTSTAAPLAPARLPAPPPARPAVKPHSDEQVPPAKLKARLLEVARGATEWVWWRYAVDQGWILSTETLDEVDINRVFPNRARDVVAEQFAQHRAAVERLYESMSEEEKAGAMNEFASASDFHPSPAQPPAETPVEKAQPPAEDASQGWAEFVVPFGKFKGSKLGEVDRKYLFGMWLNYKVEETYNGRPRSPKLIETDRQFRAALDAAGAAMKFTRPDENDIVP